MLCFGFTLSPALISLSFAGMCAIGFYLLLTQKTSSGERLIFMLFVVFYLLSFVSLFYSGNQAEAFRKLLLKIPVLGFPLIYLNFRNRTENYKLLVAVILAYAVFLPSVVSVYNYFINKTLFDQLILESKPLPIEFGYGIYHIQFSILLASAIVTATYTLIKFFRNKESRFGYYTLAILTTINFVCIHILSARTGLLALYAGLGILMISQLRFLNAKRRLILASVIIIIPVLMVVLSSSLRNRISNSIADLKVVINKSDANDYSFAMRVQAWRNAMDLIKKHPIAGVGIGDADEELPKNFATFNPSIQPQNRRNPHVQALETAVQSGIPSAVVYIVLLISLLTLKSIRNPVLSSAVILMFTASCFESILESQASVVCFSVILAFAMGFSSKSENGLTSTPVSS